MSSYFYLFYKKQSTGKNKSSTTYNNKKKEFIMMVMETSIDAINLSWVLHGQTVTISFCILKCNI